MTKRNIPSILAAGVLVAILIAYMVTFQVRYTETVVVTTFGSPSAPISEPRAVPYLKWPWPIQRVVRYDKRERVLESAEEELRTRDEQNLIVLAYATWKIAKPTKFLTSVGTVREAEPRLRRLLDTYKKSAVGRYDLAQFVNKNPDQIRLDAIETEITESMNKDAVDQFGVMVTRVGIKRLSLPEASTEQVFARMRAEQEKLVNVFRKSGEAEAARIVSEAKSARERILAFTDRVAAEIRAEGDKAAAEYYGAFKKNEDFAKFLDELDFLTETLAKRTIYVLGKKDPGTRLFAPAEDDVSVEGVPIPKVISPESGSTDQSKQK